MKVNDCIKLIDFSNEIKKEEFKQFPCLANAVFTLKKPDEDTGIEYIDEHKLILILFRAVQELKNEIDTLKAK
jgi:hypothetical protein